jgi:hypothetical protein
MKKNAGKDVSDSEIPEIISGEEPLTLWFG